MKKPVIVIWHDSRAYGNEWYDEEDIAGFCCATIKTRGYLVSQNEFKTVVAQSTDGEGRYLNIILIPQGCIKEIKTD